MAYRVLKSCRIALLLMLLSLSWLVPQVSAQDNNVCRDAGVPLISFGETLTSSLDATVPSTAICFEAERGAEITVTLSPTSQGLLTGFIVNTPFVSNDGAFEDQPIIQQTASNFGVPYQGTASIPADGTYVILIQSLQETQGSFAVTLEQSEGNVLGSSDPETSDSDADEQSTSAEEIIFGETDLCNTSITQPIAYGETIEGTASEIEFVFYCFEARENDVISIEFSVGETPMIYFMVDPFYDGSQTAPVYAQNISEPEGGVVTEELLVPRSGNYVIGVVAATQGSGNFTLTLDGVAGNIYNCNNEPLATLASTQWGIIDDSGTPVIEVNVACSERLSIGTFGGTSITFYNISQEDEFFFVFQNRLYVTTSVTEDEWVIERDDGQAYTLQPLTDGDACSQEPLATLIKGSWFWQLDPSQSVFLDFTCNGIVIIDDQATDPGTASYELAEDTITIDLGNEQLLVLEDVIITEESLEVLFTGAVFEIPNALYEAPADASEEE